MSIKKYRLLKDLPDCEAGTMLTKDSDTHYEYKDKNDLESWYTKSVVEDNPEWFELVEEKYTEIDLWETISVAFRESRLMHPVLGFKYTDFNDFRKHFKLKKGW